ncbi:hypothetical protein [Oceanisphaera pacifica]|uniref:Uncharacterized protein n=1 Tax=Oceanisphaera pacifica TaxID=2818389 RepID=A0ABS3NJL7_9GAMM|nr:hypothetical protein [Oceanisphaera pacifica]MBO1520774.1 hypothetical protein [Oceanisphaera pacifica]
MHSRWFSEEFDFCYDSKSDAADRKKGINPMREEYIANIAKKRQQQGVSPLNEAGLATSQETFELCLVQATNRIDQLVCRIDEVLFYIWDPIGVSGSNLPRDEYSRYTEQAFELALAHSSHTPLANYLTEFVTEHIGMPENKANDAKVAELIYSIVHDVEYVPDMTVVVVE